MKARVLFAAVLSFGVLALVAGRSLAEDPKAKSDKPAAKSDTKPADAKAGGKDAGGIDPKMMEAWMKSMTPGQPHAQLKAMEGNWTYTSKRRFMPDMPWDEDKGVATYKMIMGGRYIEQDIKGTKTENGMPPFEGYGVTGYDNTKKEFFNFWIDNMGTANMLSTGKADESGKTMTMKGECDCPMTGMKKAHRMVTRILSSDKMVFEMFTPDDKGKEFQCLEVTYTKKS